jgi:DNA-binding MarR family transcriptional regulator
MDKTKSNILLAIVDEILRLQSCFENVFADLECLSGLSTLQKLVLSCILDSPVPPTVPQIGRNLDRPRQVIQRVANELVREGLLEKAPNPHHRRASLLVPTPAAVELARQAEERATKTTTAFLGKVNAERCHALTSELRDLREALEALTPIDDARERPNAPALTVTGALALL